MKLPETVWLALYCAFITQRADTPYMAAERADLGLVEYQKRWEAKSSRDPDRTHTPDAYEMVQIHGGREHG